MSGDTELIKLYSARILALAADIPHLGRLTSADASVKRRSPLCGSAVTADVVVSQDQLIELGLDVKACALGQAAATLASRVAVGRTLAEIVDARDALKEMLEGKDTMPDSPFEGYEALSPAVAYKNRHASIMLTLEAITEAMEAALSAQPAQKA
ncbi:MAG: iron-sulfur cluster assembly scaffold protein [Pseudomonadota bacterium]